MMIPSESDPTWMRIISGQDVHDYEFLATKIILGRLSMIYRRDPSPETTKKSAGELREFFLRNIKLSKAQADLRKIFGEEIFS